MFARKHLAGGVPRRHSVSYYGRGRFSRESSLGQRRGRETDYQCGAVHRDTLPDFQFVSVRRDYAGLNQQYRENGAFFRSGSRVRHPALAPRHSKRPNEAPRDLPDVRDLFQLRLYGYPAGVGYFGAGMCGIRFSLYCHISSLRLDIRYFAIPTRRKAASPLVISQSRRCVACRRIAARRAVCRHAAVASAVLARRTLGTAGFAQFAARDDRFGLPSLRVSAPPPRG